MAESSTSWKPGQSGNPKGRPPKSESITGLLEEKLDKEKFVKKAIELALKGDTTVIKYIWDRLDGKVQEKILVEGDLASKIARMTPEQAVIFLKELEQGE